MKFVKNEQKIVKNGSKYVVTDGSSIEFTGLCFTANERGVRISMKSTNIPTEQLPQIEYSYDKSNWQNFVINSTTIVLKNISDNVYFRGNNSYFSTSVYKIIQFDTSGDVDLSGNIMSLLDKNCQSITIPCDYCFAYLFHGCDIVDASQLLLPATILTSHCYYKMFMVCESLITPPELPATTLAEYCYGQMFSDCSSLINIPILSSISLANGCYSSMFLSCSQLTSVPTLPATIMFQNCYHSMFAYCTSLVTVPKLPATTLVNGCYAGMFRRCTSLYVSDTQTSIAKYQWKIPNDSIGVGNYTMNDMFTDCLGTRSTDSPNFNNIQKIYYTQNLPMPVPEIPNYLCFTSYNESGYVSMSITGSPTLPVLEYSMDGYIWNDFDMTSTITLTNEGDKVYFRGDNEFFNSDELYDDNYISFYLDGVFHVSGNIMSLLDKTCKSTTIPCNACFAYAFYDCYIEDASQLILPATDLIMNDVYENMFEDCGPLEYPPELPATTLSYGCYYKMFSGCRSLIKAPELPATKLDGWCYAEMFSNCVSLIIPPELPATKVYNSSYYEMFYDCTALTSAPELPATQLDEWCYGRMFFACRSLSNPPELPAETMSYRCYSGMFTYCTNLNQVPKLSAKTLDTECYNYMFDGCSKLIVSENQTSQAAHIWKIPTSGTFNNTTTQPGMFNDVSGDRENYGDDLIATKGENRIYYTQNPPIGPDPVPTDTPLCFTANENNVTVELIKVGNPSITNTAYSLDGTTWVSFTPSETIGTNTVTLSNIGDKVYFKNTYTGPNSESNYLYFSIENFVNCSGSIMSMCSGDNYATATEIPYDYMFFNLFGGEYGYGSPIRTAPELPATTLTVACYKYMFFGCGLKISPELPAETLTESCYAGMFHDCGALEELGTIHATTYAVSCMENMFCYCYGLKQIPAMLGAHFPANCCYCMYEGCESLEMYTTSGGTHTTPYRLPASGAGTADTGAFTQMFICDTDIEDCTPSINTTYYTNATIV